MDQKTAPKQIEDAAQQTGLKPHVIRHCLRIGLVSASLTETDLVELRRVRRLTELDVNLAGAEIIIRMHRQILELIEELNELKLLDENRLKDIE